MQGQLIRDLFDNGYDIRECPIPEEGYLGVNTSTLLYAILDLVRIY